MREDVKAAFSVPILVLVGTERLTFAEAAGVLLAHKRVQRSLLSRRSF